MPRVNHVKKARKDYPNFGIKKGDSYYYWSFRFGPTIKSKNRPKPSQLTRSEFLSQIYEITECIDDLTINDIGEEGAEDLISDFVSEIESLQDETQGKLDNMPYQLQDADVGQMLQERIENLDDMISSLESIDSDVDPELDEGDFDEEIEGRTYEEAIEEEKQRILGEIKEVSYEGP